MVPLGWENYYDFDENYYPLSDINVVKSCIDTVASKIANQKVRPLMTPINQDWYSRRTIKAVQLYMDDLFYKTSQNEKISTAFKIATLYDTSALFINPFKRTLDIEALPPWAFAFDPADYQYTGGRCVHSVLVSYNNFPHELLKDIFEVGTVTTNRIKETTHHRVETFISEEHAVLYIDGKEIKSKPAYKIAPIVFLHYNNTMWGSAQTSLVDDLIRLQRRINIIDHKIQSQSDLTILNTHFIPNSTNIDIDTLDNGQGNVIQYTPAPGMTGDPIHTATPPFISDQFIAERAYLIETAYQIAGVSELSAQSEKPGGLDSGKALETMENIESNRFEYQLSTVIRQYVDLARIIIDTVPADTKVLPTNKSNVSWADVKKQADQMSIQYTATQSLSNDPEKRLEMLQQMSQIGIIAPSKIAEYMDMPDINQQFNEANQVQDAVDQLISNVVSLSAKEIDKDPKLLDIPIFIDYVTLEKEIIALQNQYFASDTEEGKENVGKLQLLYMRLKEAMTPTQSLEQTAQIGQTEQGSSGKEDPEATGGWAKTGMTQAGGIETGPQPTIDPSTLAQTAQPTQPTDMAPASTNQGAGLQQGGMLQ